MLRDYIKRLQRAMNTAGVKLELFEDGVYGPKTQAAAARFDFEIKATPKAEALKPLPPEAGTPSNPAYENAKKYAGKSEHDKKFSAWLSGFWKIVGLPGFKTIVGTSFAWCGLWIAAMNSEVGISWISNGAGARNWAKYGQGIEWQTHGIPRGAVLHINGKGNCSSAKGNHVTFADGDCTAADLKKAGAHVPGFGGNQGDTVKRSMYPVKNLCAVRWPAEIKLPPPVRKSADCAGKGSGGESTR